jgi:hypothetical protein
MEYLRNSAQRNNNKQHHLPLQVAVAAQTPLVVSTLAAVEELKMSYTLFGILIWTPDYLLIILLPTAMWQLLIVF